MVVADRLRLPRLAATINNERIRWGLEITPSEAARLQAIRTIPDDNGIAMMTAELDEDSAVRLLSASDTDDDRDLACRRASDLMARIDATRVTDLARRCADLDVPRVFVDARLNAPGQR